MSMIPPAFGFYVATAGKHQPRGVGKVVKVARERFSATLASPAWALFGSAGLLGAGSERPKGADGKRDDLPALRLAADLVIESEYGVAEGGESFWAGED